MAPINNNFLNRISAFQKCFVVGPPSSIFSAHSRSPIHINNLRYQSFFPAWRLTQHLTILVYKTTAIKHKSIISSNLVHICNDNLIVSGTSCYHLSASLHNANPKRRSRSIDDKLCSTHGTAAHWPVRSPNIFARLNCEHSKRCLKNHVTKGHAINSV